MAQLIKFPSSDPQLGHFTYQFMGLPPLSTIYFNLFLGSHFIPSKENLMRNSNTEPTKNWVAWGAVGVGRGGTLTGPPYMSASGISSDLWESQVWRSHPTVPEDPSWGIWASETQNSVEPRPLDLDSGSNVGTTLGPQEVAYPECRFQLWRELPLCIPCIHLVEREHIAQDFVSGQNTVQPHKKNNFVITHIQSYQKYFIVSHP